MPLPTPNEGETEQEFHSRCMANETIRADFATQEQRNAVCYKQWDRAKGVRYGACAPICDECAAKVMPELWELTMPAAIPEPCVYCGTETKSIREYRKAVDPNVGGGVDREKLKGGDFVFPDTRTFPVKTPGDVSDAVSSWGRYKGPHSFEDFKRKLIALCKRKGPSFVAALPKEWKEEKEKAANPLKTVSRNDSELRVANYIVLFGGRDLEGYGSDTVNGDGSRGEYFTKSTVFDSPYTKAGGFYVDWEHRQGELGDELLGIVDWKTAKIDDKGIFVERVLNRRSQYVRWVESLIDDGLIGTSSEADPKGVEKGADGAITRWPLYRDTLTVSPMEPRMLTENHIQAFKALGIQLPEHNPEPELETEAEPEADPSAVSVVKAKARNTLFLLDLMEV